MKLGISIRIVVDQALDEMTNCKRVKKKRKEWNSRQCQIARERETEFLIWILIVVDHQRDEMTKTVGRKKAERESKCGKCPRKRKKKLNLDSNHDFFRFRLRINVVLRIKCWDKCEIRVERSR